MISLGLPLSMTPGSYAAVAAIPPAVILPNGDFSSSSAPPNPGSNVNISGGLCNCTGAGQIVTWTNVLTLTHRYLPTLQYNSSSGNRLRVNNSASNGVNVKDVQVVTVDGATHSMPFFAFVADNVDFSIEAQAATYAGWLDNAVLTELPNNLILTNGDFYQDASTAGPTLGAGASNQVPGAVTFVTAAAALATWIGKLTPGTSYSVLVNYIATAGTNLRLSNSNADGTSVVDTKPITADGVARQVTLGPFTAGSADLVLAANGGVFTGNLTSVIAS